MDQTAARVMRAFTQSFGEPGIIVRSPGRINLIGEHTDYNEGYVLPAAVSMAAFVAASLRNDDQIHLIAADLDASMQTTLDDLTPKPGAGWPAYLLGSAAQFHQKGFLKRGFNLALASDVPIGAGLSSSAAVECATVFAFNELLKTGFTRTEMAFMAQRAEHEFAGVHCGIMDQFASLLGRSDHFIRLDCRSLQYDYIPFEQAGLKLILLNSNVRHSLAESAYNERRLACETAVQWIQEKYPQVRSLRDATEFMLNECVMPRDAVIDRRARYVIRENERLLRVCNALQQGDIRTVGQCLYATHEGLSKDYEVSCRELDWLVAAVRDMPGVVGARMMGGGFGGCTINLVQADAVDALVARLAPSYREATGLELTYYEAIPAQGTSVMAMQ